MDVKFHSPFICCTTQTAGSHVFANLYNQLWTLYVPRGGTWVNFYCACATDVSQSLPHLHIVYLVANYRSNVNSHFWANLFLLTKTSNAFQLLVGWPY